MNSYPFIKRTIDLLAAVVGLVVAAPVMLVVAGLIRWRMGRPVFFRQTRPGYRGQPFLLLKFRTMNGGAGPDAERLTPLGRWLRRTSLDELPQLLNVVRGDLSLVGPRPLLMQYLDRYTPEQARRHEVKPGITGWAQVHGRNAISWEEKLSLDVWYVDHRSLRLDAAILWRTLRGVLKAEGVNHPGSATMPEFTGTPCPVGRKQPPISRCETSR